LLPGRDEVQQFLAGGLDLVPLEHCDRLRETDDGHALDVLDKNVVILGNGHRVDSSGWSSTTKIGTASFPEWSAVAARGTSSGRIEHQAVDASIIDGTRRLSHPVSRLGRPAIGGFLGSP